LINLKEHYQQQAKALLGRSGEYPQQDQESGCQRSITREVGVRPRAHQEGCLDVCESQEHGQPAVGESGREEEAGDAEDGAAAVEPLPEPGRGREHQSQVSRKMLVTDLLLCMTQRSPRIGRNSQVLATLKGLVPAKQRDKFDFDDSDSAKDSDSSEY